MLTGRIGSRFAWVQTTLASAAFSIVAFPAFARLPLAVPEPTTLSLFGAGVVGVIALYRMGRGK